MVEEEVTGLSMEIGLQAANAVEAAFQTIEKLTGQRPTYAPPTEAALRAAIGQRLSELERFIIRLPFTLDHAKSAMKRVQQGTPPNSQKTQQFKDSTIWEAVLELARSRPVHFATRDHAFFQEKKPENGLASNLRHDLEALPYPVHVYPDLSKLLAALSNVIPELDLGVALTAVERVVRPHVESDAARRHFALGQLKSHSLSPFLTESVAFLAINFEITYRLVDESDPGLEIRTGASATAKGTCGYELDTRTASDPQLDEIEFKWLTQAGVESKVRTIFLRGSITFGRPATTPYRLRRRLAQ